MGGIDEEPSKGRVFGRFLKNFNPKELVISRGLALG